MAAVWILYRDSSPYDSGEEPTLAKAKTAAKAKLQAFGAATHWAKVWDRDGGPTLVSSRNRAGAIAFKASRF